MALHIMNAPDTDLDFGKILGTGLQALAQHKINKHQLEHKLRFLRGSGLSEEQALHGAHLPEEHFGQLLKNISHYRTGADNGQPTTNNAPTFTEREDYKLKLQEEHERKQREEEEIQKSQTFYTKELERDFAAKEELRQIKKLEHLNEHGKLGGPLWNSAIESLNKVGINLSSFLTTDAQEFEKTKNAFISNVKELFPGGKITNFELDSYLKTIPSLFQTKSGRKRVIDDMKLLNESRSIKKKIADQIISKNGGKVPANLDQLIYQKAGDKLEDLESRFVNSANKDIAKNYKQIAEVDEYPDPKKYKGKRTIIDNKWYQSNGDEWVPEK